MKLELLVIPQCPGVEEASILLRTALDDVGLTETGFTTDVIDSEGAAQARHFAGSPTFVADGIDLFGGEGGPGSMACRLYVTPDGPRNLPSLSDLRQALVRCVALTVASPEELTRNGVEVGRVGLEPTTDGL